MGRWARTLWLVTPHVGSLQPPAPSNRACWFALSGKEIELELEFYLSGCVPHSISRAPTARPPIQTLRLSTAGW